MLPFSVAQEPVAGGSRQNAFELLMSAQQQLSHKSMPDLISEPKTKKQTLMNDVITFLREMDCQWPSNEVSAVGMSLVNALMDTLWTVDGHHHVFASQGHQIPPIFTKFVGYNQPELSKHRKRQASNMSATVLQSLSSHLFHCLQGSYWYRFGWLVMRTDVEQLAQSLAEYTDYLETSKKKMKLHHTLTSPIRVLADNIQFQFLPVRGSVPCTLLEGLDAQLGEVPDYQYVLVEDVCPADYRAKYIYPDHEEYWL